MAELKRKLNAIKNIFAKGPQYKRFHNYDPNNPFPNPGESYKKFDSPKPPQKGKNRQRGGKRRKQRGGKRQKGGKRRKQRGGIRQKGGKSIKRRK